MSLVSDWISRRKFWSLLAALAACAVLTLWYASQRPDRIRPQIYGSGIDRDSMEPIEVTIYEYTDRENWVTNGRSITLRIPMAYLTYSAALAGGAQAQIMIDFDAETGAPWTKEHRLALSDQRAAEVPTSSDANSAYLWSRRISANLSVFRRPFSARQAMGLLGAKLGNPEWLYKNFAYLDESICGYDMFRDTSVHGTKSVIPARYPFDRANVFARTDKTQGYDTMVECVALDRGAWCHATREFEGFSLTIHFDGSRLCSVDAAFDRTNTLLSGLVVQRNPAIEGWGSKD